MAAVTHRVATASTSNVTSYASGSFVPGNGELLVALVAASGTQATGSMSDSLGGSWYLAASANKNTDVDRLYCFVRTALIGTGVSMTVTFDCTGDAATGAAVFVAGVSGMSLAGAAAVRQFDVEENQGAGVTPNFTFPAAALTGNPTFAFMGNSVNPAAVTEPSGWTERADSGYETPSKGAEYATRDSGFTGTTVTWGAATSTVWASIGVELDTTSGDATGSGSPTKTLSKSAAGTAVQKFTGSGTPTKTLSKSAAGTAVQKFTGSGTPTKTLSKSAAGTAVQKFTGSGTPSKTLSKSAAGVATHTVNDDVVGSGAPTKTLSKSAAGVATHTKDSVAGAGAATKIMSTSAVGVATQKFSGSGTPTKTLSKSAVGVATHTGFVGPVWTGLSNFGAATGDRALNWPGSSPLAEDSAVVVGDVAFLFIETANEVVASVTATGAGTPSNFALIAPAGDGIGTAGADSATRLTVYWCRATSHDMSPVTIADAGNHIGAVIATFRGCILTGNPWDVIATPTVTSPTSTAMSIPGATATVANTLVIGAATRETDSATASLSGLANASLVNVAEIIDYSHDIASGGGLVLVKGEKNDAGAYSAFTGTQSASTRSISVSIALKPTPAPVNSTGSGAPSKTLSKSAAGVASQKFTGSGAPIKTLSKSAAGVATHSLTGTGAAVKTLSKSAAGVASQTFTGSGSPTKTLTKTARGTAYSEGIPVEVPRPPRRAAGGSRRVYVVAPEKEKPEKKKRPTPAPRPATEAPPELPRLESFVPSPLPVRVFDPMAWQTLTAPTRVDVPVGLQPWEIEEEELFLQRILEVI